MLPCPWGKKRLNFSKNQNVLPMSSFSNQKTNNLLTSNFNKTND